MGSIDGKMIFPYGINNSGQIIGWGWKRNRDKISRLSPDTNSGAGDVFAAYDWGSVCDEIFQPQMNADKHQSFSPTVSLSGTLHTLPVYEPFHQKNPANIMKKPYENGTI